MPAPTALVPSHPVPALSGPLVGGGTWDGTAAKSENFTLVVFYRGYHCPKCREQLHELRDHLEAFAETGTNVVAVSMDPQDRAEKTKTEWETGNLPLVYDATIEDAKNWGLHLSRSRGMTSIGVEELAVFNEPGMFLIRNDGTLFASWVQTIPMARPPAAGIIGLIKFVLDKGYPPRGDVTDL